MDWHNGHWKLVCSKKLDFYALAGIREKLAYYGLDGTVGPGGPDGIRLGWSELWYQAQYFYCRHWTLS